MDNGIFNSPVLARTQILVHTRGGGRTRILPLFCRRTYPGAELVPSVAQANIKGVGLVLH